MYEEHLLANLREMDEYKFEHFIAQLWENYGWEAEVTSNSGDSGIDIKVEKDDPVPLKHAIQVKCWKEGNSVGRPEIQQYNSIREQEDDVDSVIIVTTSSFSRPAVQLGKKLNVKLVDGSKLYSIIEKADSRELVERYMSFNQQSEDCEKSRYSQEIECSCCYKQFEDMGLFADHFLSEHDINEVDESEYNHIMRRLWAARY